MPNEKPNLRLLNANNSSQALLSVQPVSNQDNAIMDMQIKDGSFYVCFEQDIDLLHAGTYMRLELPNKNRNNEGNGYSDNLIATALQVVSNQYSDLELSIMKIVEDTNLSLVTIRETTTYIPEPSKDLDWMLCGKKSERIFGDIYFKILKYKGDYIPAYDDIEHEQVTSNAALMADTGLMMILGKYELGVLFDAAEAREPY